jgi:hypothetical protein
MQMSKDTGKLTTGLVAALSRIYRGYDKAFSVRKRSFHVYGSGSDYHVLALDDGGGFVVCDSIQHHEQATAIAELLNFAVALCGALDRDENQISARPQHDARCNGGAADMGAHR